MNLQTYSVLGLSVFLRIPVLEPPRCTDPISRLATGSLLTDLKNLFKPLFLCSFTPQTVHYLVKETLVESDLEIEANRLFLDKEIFPTKIII